MAAIDKDSAADKGGLEVGDVIIEVDGTKIKSAAHLKFMLYKHEIGDTIKLKINREGKEKDLSMKLDKSLGD